MPPPRPSAHRLALAAIFALLLLATLWQLWWFPPERVSRPFALALHLAPMLPAALLALLGRRSAAFWGGCGALLLFCHGVMEAWAAPASRPAAWLEILLSLAVVGGASWNGLRHRFARKRSV